MSGNSKNRSGGGKRPNSPRYSERYGKGHINPYLGGQPKHETLLREIEERQNAVRAENEQEIRRAWEQAAAEAAERKQRESQAAAAERANTAHSTARKRARDNAEQPRAGRDPQMQERLRQIQEQAMLEAKAFSEDQRQSGESFDDSNTVPDVKLKLSDDNKPLIALESRGSDGRLEVKWVPVVLSEEEMEAFFPAAIEPRQDSAEAEPAENEESVPENVEETSEEELVLIPIAGMDDEPSGAAVAVPVAAAAAVELLGGAEVDRKDEPAAESAPADESLIDGLPVIPITETEDEADDDDEAENDDQQSEDNAVPVVPVVTDEEEEPEEDEPEDDTGEDESESDPEEETQEQEEETQEQEEETQEQEEETQEQEEEADEAVETPDAEDESSADHSEDAEESPEPENDILDEPEETSTTDEEDTQTESEPDEPEESAIMPDTDSEDAPVTHDDAAADDAGQPENAEEDSHDPQPEEEPRNERTGGQRAERPKHKRRRSRPSDVACPVEIIFPEQSEADRTPAENAVYDEDIRPAAEEAPAKRRTAVASRPVYDELNASSRYSESRYQESDGQDDSLFVRKDRPGSTALFMLPDGARLPKYIDDDDFVERWLGNEEEEDMASDSKRRRRRISTLIGALTMVLALIGFIAVARWGIGMLSGLGNTDSQKTEYAEFISPIVMSEVPVFETWDAIPQDKLLQSAVFSVLEDMDVTYERDDTGKFIIPSTDIVNEVKELYGAYSTDSVQDDEINTNIRNALYGSAGEDTTNTDVYYVDMEDSFHVADGLSGPAPLVTDISRRDNTITLVVQYLEDLEGGSGGILYAREYILTLDGDGYYVKALREYEE